PLELFTPGEIVVAGLELEIHEIRFGHEPWRWNRRGTRWPGILVGWHVFRRFVFLLVLFLLFLALLRPLLETLALALRPTVLVLLALVLCDGHAVEAN